MEKFYVEFNEEQGNYLQRLGAEVDGKIFLIDRMFANHAADTDTALFDSIPFKYYHKEYEKAYTAWDLAKKAFKEDVLDPIVKEKTGLDNVQYNWKIDNFKSGLCEISIIE